MTTPSHHQGHAEGGDDRPAPETSAPAVPAPESSKARRSRLIGQGVALGMGLGVAFGTLFGVLFFDNVVFGLPLGGLGVGIGAAVGSRRAEANDREILRRTEEESGADGPWPMNANRKRTD